jgi:hypothetical protein
MKKIKKIILFVCICFCICVTNGTAFATFSFDDVDFWAGNGENQAGLVVHWSSPEVFNNTSMPASVEDVSYAWGYQFDGTATAEDMMVALAAADPNLYVFAGGQAGLGMAIFGIGYDYDGDGEFGLSDGSTTYTAADFTNGIIDNQAYGDADTFLPTDSGDLYWSGWYGPNWELWHEQDGNGGFTDAPDRGTDTYWTGDGWSGSHGEWDFSGVGISSLSLEDSSWVGWSVAAAGLDFANPEAMSAWMDNKQAPAEPIAAPVPVPAAVWLLGSGLLGLVGIRRKTS